MTREEIVRVAREAGMFVTSELKGQTDKLERFAALVAAHEREACAKVCDLVAKEIDDTNGNATYCAAAIRARGQ